MKWTCERWLCLCAQECIPTSLSNINVASFSSISYGSNSEYWTQKRTQSENIHYIILDVHAVKQSRAHFIWDYKEG